MSRVHPAAARGFESGATAYAAGRPDYAAATLDWLTDDLHLGPGRTVVEIGAGTGKFTSRLRATGARVIAVEPVDAMRAELAMAYPDVRSLAATANALPLDTASVDAVVCAQSFHWFAQATAVAEFRRVLKPGGMLGLIWNVRDTRVSWVDALTDIMAPFEDDTPREAHGHWRRLFPAAGFGALAERHFPNTHRGPAERVIVDRTLSVSFIAALSESRRAEVAGQVRALIHRTPALRDAASVEFPYDTAAYCCQRRD